MSQQPPTGRSAAGAPGTPGWPAAQASAYPGNPYQANPYQANPYAGPPAPVEYPIRPPTGIVPAHGSVLVVRLLGLGLTLLLVLVGGAAVAGEFFRQQTEVSSTVDGEIDHVVATTDVGDVRVHPGEAGRPIVVSRKLSWTIHRPVVTITRQGTRLDITARCLPSGLSLAGCTADLELTIPRTASLVLHSATGDLRADGLAGDLRATSTAGNIDLQGLRAASVSASSNAGDVQISTVSPPRSVTVRTTAGDVRVTVPPDGTAYRVTSRTSAGDRQLQVPTDPVASRSIDVTSTAGSIVVATAP